MLGRFPIRRRLQLVIILTAGMALALACGTFLVLEWRTSLSAERQALVSSGRISADASTAALAFLNPADAQRVHLILGLQGAEWIDSASGVKRSPMGVHLRRNVPAKDAGRRSPTSPGADWSPSRIAGEGERQWRVHGVLVPPGLSSRRSTSARQPS